MKCERRILARAKQKEMKLQHKVGGEGDVGTLNETQFKSKFNCKYCESIIPRHLTCLQQDKPGPHSEDKIDSDEEEDQEDNSHCVEGKSTLNVLNIPFSAHHFSSFYASSRPFLQSVLHLFPPHPSPLSTMFCLFDTLHPNVGHIVVATQNIAKGTPLFIYSGKEVDKSTIDHSSVSSSTDSSPHDSSVDYVLHDIDAFQYGGVSRFLPHLPLSIRKSHPTEDSNNNNVSTINHPILSSSSPFSPSDIAVSNVQFQRVPLSLSVDPRVKYDVMVGISNQDIESGDVVGFSYCSEGNGKDGQAEDNLWWTSRKYKFKDGPLLLTRKGNVVEMKGNYRYDTI